MREKTCETCGNFVLSGAYPYETGTCILIHGAGGDRPERTPRVAPMGSTGAWLLVPLKFGCVLHQPRAPSPETEGR